MAQDSSYAVERSYSFKEQISCGKDCIKISVEINDVAAPFLYEIEKILDAAYEEIKGTLFRKSVTR